MLFDIIITVSVVSYGLFRKGTLEGKTGKERGLQNAK